MFVQREIKCLSKEIKNAGKQVRHVPSLMHKPLLTGTYRRTDENWSSGRRLVGMAGMGWLGWPGRELRTTTDENLLGWLARLVGWVGLAGLARQMGEQTNNSGRELNLWAETCWAGWMSWAGRAFQAGGRTKTTTTTTTITRTTRYRRREKEQAQKSYEMKQNGIRGRSEKNKLQQTTMSLSWWQWNR